MTVGTEGAGGFNHWTVFVRKNRSKHNSPLNGLAINVKFPSISQFDL